MKVIKLPKTKRLSKKKFVQWVLDYPGPLNMEINEKIIEFYDPFSEPKNMVVGYIEKGWFGRKIYRIYI